MTEIQELLNQINAHTSEIRRQLATPVDHVAMLTKEQRTIIFIEEMALIREALLDAIKPDPDRAPRVWDWNSREIPETGVRFIDSDGDLWEAVDDGYQVASGGMISSWRAIVNYAPFTEVLDN